MDHKPIGSPNAAGETGEISKEMDMNVNREQGRAETA